MEILIRGETSHKLQCNGTEKVGDLRSKIAKLEKLMQDFSLYSNSRPVSDDSPISDYHTLEICVPVPGGKVHGSLSRAGKVKSQTPKVEKQEKKKKKTGRAKKRQQYNQRFINGERIKPNRSG